MEINSTKVLINRLPLYINAFKTVGRGDPIIFKVNGICFARDWQLCTWLYTIVLAILIYKTLPSLMVIGSWDHAYFIWFTGMRGAYYRNASLVCQNALSEI